MSSNNTNITEFKSYAAELANMTTSLRDRAEKTVIMAANYGLVVEAKMLASAIEIQRSCISRIVFVDSQAPALLAIINELTDSAIFILDLDNQIQLKLLNLMSQNLKEAIPNLITVKGVSK